MSIDTSLVQRRSAERLLDVCRNEADRCRRVARAIGTDHGDMRLAYCVVELDAMAALFDDLAKRIENGG